MANKLQSSTWQHHESGDLETTSRKWFALGLFFLVLGGAALLGAQAAEPDAWWMHGAWCIVGLCATVPTVILSLRRGFIAVLGDHLVVFAGAFSVYFLFGASFVTFGSEESVMLSLQFHDLDATDALRTDAVNGIGFGVSLITAALAPRNWIGRLTYRLASRAKDIPQILVMGLLLAMGLTALSFVLVHDLGFYVEDRLPGFLRNVAKLPIVVIFLAASYRGNYQTAVRSAAPLLAIAYATIGLIEFNKTDVLLPLCALVAGMALVRRPLRVVPLGLVVVISVYIATSGPVNYSRKVLANETAPLSERLSIMGEGYSAAQVGDPAADASPWGRLSYVASQAAGMYLYDQGFGGNDFELLPWTLVPRALVPSKPEITRSPRLFYQKVTGQTEGTSSTGQGVFSTGYYSGGWPGVIAASVLVGFVLAQTRSAAGSILRARAPLLIPFLLSGVLMAFRIDGSFIIDYVGAFVIFLAGLVLAKFMTDVLAALHYVQSDNYQNSF